MVYFDRQFASASPVLTLSPQAPHQTSLGMSSFASQQMRPDFVGSMATATSPATNWRPAVSAGRKRSRDEAAVNIEPDVAPELPTAESETGWTYGPGMVLIKPETGYVVDASSQSGTWLEEKIDKATVEATRQLEAQSIASRCHKSQRFDQSRLDSSESRGVGNMAAANTPHAPIIDDATVHLGIGWRKMSEDEDVQAAARGWARYIENHYPLTDVHIRLESKGLQSFLVEACEGFFLFAENLRHGRLVSRTVDGALRNLQCTPPTFEGAGDLSPAESPRAAATEHESSAANGCMELD